MAESTVGKSAFPKQDYPWTRTPLIVSAPMGGFATAPLATSVSLAGGIGLIGAVADFTAIETELSNARRTFVEAGLVADHEKHDGSNNSAASTSTDPTKMPPLMPIGIGFLLFLVPMKSALDLIRKHRPSIVWLSFARSFSDFATWTSAIRSASPGTKIWIMLGSVAAALEVVPIAKPDVLIMQGGDAGGHGFVEAVGVMSLVPETMDALEQSGYGAVPVLAAGGIVDGRGVAAAMALGAKGVVVGTRFLASQEVVVPHPAYQDVIVGAKDGGRATVRATVFDELRGKNPWPARYDGRAIRNQSWRDRQDGVDVVEIRERFSVAEKGGDAGYGVEGDAATGRIMVWAGAGVGLVKKVRKSSEILEELRDGARIAMEKAKARL